MKPLVLIGIGLVIACTREPSPPSKVEATARKPAVLGIGQCAAVEEVEEAEAADATQAAPREVAKPQPRGHSCTGSLASTGPALRLTSAVTPLR